MCNECRAIVAFYCGLGPCPLLSLVLDTAGASHHCSESSACISFDCNLGTSELLYILFQMTRFHWLQQTVTPSINMGGFQWN